MLIPGNLHKMVFGGTLATTETWACSIHFASPDAEPRDAAADLALCVGPVHAWFTSLDSHINQSARLDFLKLNQVNKGDGKYTSQQAANTFFWDPATVPHALNSNGPPQITAAVTWHSDLARGRGSKGRIYPPTNTAQNNTVQIDGFGHYGTNHGQEMAHSAGDLLRALNEQLDPMVAVVWSQIGQSAHRVERTSCGLAADTQLRRRKNIKEERVFDAELMFIP